MNISFDESLAKFAAALTKAGVDTSATAGVFIRDSRGRLSFVSASDVSQVITEKVTNAITKDLRPYVSPIGPIADREAPGASHVLRDRSASKFDLEIADGKHVVIRLLDRRAVGGDWLHFPIEPVASPPRMVSPSRTSIETMVPWIGAAHVAYIPNGRVVGLSKLARLVDVYARRLQTQEHLTSQIATAIEEILMPRGVAVMLEAEHMCMSLRGVEKPGSSTITTQFAGSFRDNPDQQVRFITMVRGAER